MKRIARPCLSIVLSFALAFSMFAISPIAADADEGAENSSSAPVVAEVNDLETINLGTAQAVIKQSVDEEGGGNLYLCIFRTC